MEKGFRFRWQLLLGASLAMACFSCRPAAPRYPGRRCRRPRWSAPEQPPERPSFYVKVARLNLRAGPGMDFPKLGTLERNEEVEKVGEAENWYQVRVKRDGTLGWVSSEHLSSTPVSSPIQTPVPETPVVPSAREKDDAPAAAACGGQTQAPGPGQDQPATPRSPSRRKLRSRRHRRPEEPRRGIGPGPEGRARKSPLPNRGAAAPAEASPAGP